MQLHRILHGDVLRGLATLPDESVHCCISSPPYWTLRSYETELWEDGDPDCEHEIDPTTNTCLKCNARYTDEQIGIEQDPSEYIIKLVEVFREVRRVLRSDGVAWINMGDCFSPQSSHRAVNTERGGNFNQVSRGVKDALEFPAFGKHKDLMGMPWRLVLALQADGWYWRQWMPWLKRASIPESTPDRPASACEVVFLLSKSCRTNYWIHRALPGARKKPLPDWRIKDFLTNNEYTEKPPGFKQGERIPCPDCEGNGLIVGGWFGGEGICETCEGTGKIKRWRRINLWEGHDYFYDGEAVRMPQTGNAHSRGSGVNPKATPTGKGIRSNVSFKAAISEVEVPGGRCRRNTDWFFESWQGMITGTWGEPLAFVVNPQPTPELHFAHFPEKLIEPMILAGTSEKGCCPKCGAPWVRVIEKGQPDAAWKKVSGADSTGGYQGVSHKQDQLGKKTYTGFNARCKVQNASNVKRNVLAGMRERLTTWRPSCDCGIPENETIPCTVLDPFLGTGTVTVVSRDNGRSSVGIELAKGSIDIIRRRLKINEQLDTGYWKFEVTQV